jgi:hypothetical protein
MGSTTSSKSPQVIGLRAFCFVDECMSANRAAGLNARAMLKGK